MLILKRKKFFLYSTFAFLALLPFLVLYSLGFNINFNSRTVNYSLNVRLETIPFTTEVKINDKTITDLTPTDIRVTSNQVNNIKLDVNKNGYVSEQFVFSGVSNNNSSVRISSLYLLSQNGNELEGFDPSEKKNINFVGENIIFQDSNKQFKLRPFNLISSNNDIKVINLNNIQFDKDSVFEEVSVNTFFDYTNKHIVYFYNSEWKILDLKNSWTDSNNQVNSLNEFNINSIIEGNEENLLFTNKNHQLIQFNKKKQSLYIVDTDVISIAKSKSPEALWILTNNGIEKIQEYDFDTENNVLVYKINQSNQGFYQDEIYNSASKCKETVFCKFKIENVLSGSVFQIDNKFFYIENNTDKQVVSLLSDSLKKFVVNKDAIFFIDNANNIYVINTFNKSVEYISSLKNSDVVYNLEYLPDWKRLIISQEQGIKSVWYDVDVINNKIINYNVQNWTNKQCSIYLFDKILVCKNSAGKIEYYQNNKII